MIAFVSSGLPRKGEPSGKTSRSPNEWRERILRSVLNWLTEPIPFPGKWPSRDSRQEKYNTGRYREMTE